MAQAELAFEAVARYLYANRWFQDGQDPGLWYLRVGEQDRLEVTVGDALRLQYEADNFQPWVYNERQGRLKRMAQSTEARGGGIGFTGLLTILFIALKLTGYIGWSWWWVLSPIWISALGAVAITLIVLLFVLIAAVIDR